jgi:uncharacterized protein
MNQAIYTIAAVAALGLVAPAEAQTSAQRATVELAPGEILLHISAQGRVPADYATIEVEQSERAKSQAEAVAALREEQRTTETALAEMGIGRSALQFGEVNVRQSLEYDRDVLSIIMEADIDAADAAEAAMDDGEAAANAASEAVANAVAEAGAAVEAAAAESDEPRRVPFWHASSTLTVTVDDLTKLEGLTQRLRIGDSYPRQRPRFRFRDEAGAERAAVAAAIAEARADAEIHADALGYRLVRIVAVSNDGARLSLPNILQAMGTIDNPSRDMTFVAQKIATVSIDFAIAPR